MRQHQSSVVNTFHFSRLDRVILEFIRVVVSSNQDDWTILHTECHHTLPPCRERKIEKQNGSILPIIEKKNQIQTHVSIYMIQCRDHSGKVVPALFYRLSPDQSLGFYLYCITSITILPFRTNGNQNTDQIHRNESTSSGERNSPMAVHLVCRGHVPGFHSLLAISERTR